MLWLTWHMWILLLLAFAGGVITGWVLRSKSDAPDEPLPQLGFATRFEPKPAPDAPPAAPDAPEPANADDREAPASAPAAASDAGDLTQITGLGPKAAEKLNEAGVTHIAQIAAWSDEDIERFDALINGRGRIRRDDWVGQAKKLS